MKKESLHHNYIYKLHVLINQTCLYKPIVRPRPSTEWPPAVGTGVWPPGGAAVGAPYFRGLSGSTSGTQHALLQASVVLQGRQKGRCPTQTRPSGRARVARRKWGHYWRQWLPQWRFSDSLHCSSHYFRSYYWGHRDPWRPQWSSPDSNCPTSC